MVLGLAGESNRRSYLPAVPFGFDGQLQGVVATDDTFVTAGSGYDGLLPNRQLIVARYGWDLSVVTERFIDIGPGTSADAEALAVHPGGGFVVVGSAGGDGLVVRVDDTGAFLSSNVIGDPRLDGFYDVAIAAGPR